MPYQIIGKPHRLYFRNRFHPSPQSRRGPVARSFAEFERDFWENVWQCTHRHPCKKCCWPWYPAFKKGRGSVRPTHATVKVPGVSSPQLVHRLALIFTQHAWLLPFGSQVHVCHLCHFPLCCNPSHLVVGTRWDNLREVYDRPTKEPRVSGPIILPSGVVIRLDYRLLPRRKKP